MDTLWGFTTVVSFPLPGTHQAARPLRLKRLSLNLFIELCEIADASRAQQLIVFTRIAPGSTAEGRLPLPRRK
jgi:hypothetical protein